MSNRILFPISVDSGLFRTAVVTSALGALCERYDEILFLVADRLQMYNKATLVLNGDELREILAGFEAKNSYLEERRRWLGSLQQRLGDVGKWTIWGVDRFADGHFIQILRRVTLAFCVLDSFRNDVKQSARVHKEKLTTIKCDDESRQRLCEAYLLEEIALNLRVRVVEDILSEYYLGETIRPLIRLYRGDYGIDVFALAGMAPAHRQWEFYTYQTVNGKAAWALC